MEFTGVIDPEYLENACQIKGAKRTKTGLEARMFVMRTLPQDMVNLDDVPLYINQMSEASNEVCERLSTGAFRG